MMAVAELLVTGVLSALGDGAYDRMRAIEGSATALRLYQVVRLAFAAAT